MKKRERVLAAIELEEPDRVPTHEYIDYSIIPKIINKPTPTPPVFIHGIRDVEKREKIIKTYAKNRVECYMLLNIDSVHEFFCTPEEWEPKIVKKDEKTGDIYYRCEFSMLWRYSPMNDRTFYAGPAVEDLDKIDEYEFPDFSAPGRMDVLEALIKEAGEKVHIAGMVWGPFEHTWRITGIERFFHLLFREPLRAYKLVDSMVDLNIEIGKMMLDLGVDVIFIADDCAYKTGPMMSPAHYRLLNVPRIERMVKAFRRQGALVIYHSDGNLYPILNDVVETGIDGLHSIEPQAGMDIAKVKEEYGDKICLLGNIDVSITMPLGTPQQVEKEVYECIQKAAPGGGLILCSSNSIYGGVPIENIKTMFNAAGKHGKYPIAPT